MQAHYRTVSHEGSFEVPGRWERGLNDVWASLSVACAFNDMIVLRKHWANGIPWWNRSLLYTHQHVTDKFHTAFQSKHRLCTCTALMTSSVLCARCFPGANWTSCNICRLCHTKVRPLLLCIVYVFMSACNLYALWRRLSCAVTSLVVYGVVWLAACRVLWCHVVSCCIW